MAWVVIKPDTATFRAIIDFHSLTIRHDKINGCTDWTFHGGASLVRCSTSGRLFLAYRRQLPRVVADRSAKSPVFFKFHRLGLAAGHYRSGCVIGGVIKQVRVN